MDAVPRNPDPFALVRDLAPPAKRGTHDKPRVLKQVQRRHALRPQRRKEVVQWSYKLASWVSTLRLPANGRAVKRIYSALIELMEWRSGRLDPAGRTIGRRADYSSQTTVWTWIGWLKERGILAVIPCCTRVVSPDGRFFLTQDTNVYVFQPPTHWRGYEPAARSSPKAAAEAQPMQDAEGQLAQLRQKLAAAEDQLAAEPDNAGTAALVRFYREQLAAHSPP